MQDGSEYGLVVLDQVGWDSVIVHGHESGMLAWTSANEAVHHTPVPRSMRMATEVEPNPRLGGPSITPPGLGSARLRKRPLHSP